MIKADAIEAVFQCEDPLDLVRLNHGYENITHRESLNSLAHTVSAQVICDSENGTEIIRRMSPFRGEPRVVEIEPAHDRADIERGLNRVQLVTGSRYTRARARHRCAWHHRTEKLRASGIIQRQKAASKRIHETKTCGIKRFVARYFFDFENVIGNPLQDRIRFRTHGTC